MKNTTEQYIEYTRDEIMLNVENNIDWYSQNLTLIKRVFEVRDTELIESLIRQKVFTNKKIKTVVKSTKSILKSLNRNKNVSRTDEKIVMDFTEVLSDVDIVYTSKLLDLRYTQQEIDERNQVYEDFFSILRYMFLYLNFKLNPEKGYVRYYPNQ
jgi:hypothetical protein